MVKLSLQRRWRLLWGWWWPGFGRFRWCKGCHKYWQVGPILVRWYPNAD